MTISSYDNPVFNNISENLKVIDKTDAHPITNAAGPYYVIFK